MALIVAGLFFQAYGVSAIRAYGDILKGALGSQLGLTETVRRMIPLLVIGVGTHRLAPAIRRLVPATMGVALVAVGILTALTRVPLASAAVSAAGHVDAVNCDRAVECVEELERGGLPCCGDAQ